jgi:hypothetical protein
MIEEIKQKIQELSQLGKEKSELDLWLKLLPIMSQEEQKELLESLDSEIKFIRKNTSE